MKRIIKSIIIVVTGFIFAQNILFPQNIESKIISILIPGKLHYLPNGVPVCQCPVFNNSDCACLFEI